MFLNKIKKIKKKLFDRFKKIWLAIDKKLFKFLNI